MDKQRLLELKEYLEDEWDVVNKFELLKLWDDMEYAEEQLEKEQDDDIFNRRGKFYVGHDLIKQMTKNPELYSDFWYHFIVLRAESRFDKDAIEYVACSGLFDYVNEEETIPYYTIVINHMGSDSLTIDVHRGE